MLNVGKIMSELKRMTVHQLRDRYAEVFKEQTRSYHKDFLIRRILWRMQADAEGGLPERARQRALEIARDSDLRLRAPSSLASLAAKAGTASAAPSTLELATPFGIAADQRLPMPGAVITRKYKGKEVVVNVLPKGFEYEGTTYRSLSAVAKAVTGTHWNGFLFFGIERPTEKP